VTEECPALQPPGCLLRAAIQRPIMSTARTGRMYYNKDSDVVSRNETASAMRVMQCNGVGKRCTRTGARCTQSMCNEILKPVRPITYRPPRPAVYILWIRFVAPKLSRRCLVSWHLTWLLW
jgi:hypothetical protein